MKQLSEKGDKIKLNINQQLKKKWFEQQQAFLSLVKEWKQEINDKQESQRSVLSERLKQSLKTKENEAKEAMKYVSDKTNKQMEIIHREYQKYHSSWNQELENKKVAALNKVNAHAMEVQRNINRKLHSFKAEREADYQSNQIKLRKHHQKRRDELNAMISQKKSKLDEKHKQERILIDQLQQDRMQKLRDKVIKERSKLLCSGKEDNVETKLQNEYNKSDPNETTQIENRSKDAAVLRYKRRQSVFMKPYIPVSLHVQLHDEGLGITWRSKKISESEKSDFDFVPWGFKARQFLHSIVCGELNIDDILDADANCEDLLQGGQIKCVISDVRKHYGDKVISDCESKVDSDKCKQLESGMLDLRQKMDNISKSELKSKEMLLKVDMALRQYQDKIDQTRRMYQGKASFCN